LITVTVRLERKIFPKEQVIKQINLLYYGDFFTSRSTNLEFETQFLNGLMIMSYSNW
jgi:hypothetical protein